MVDVASASSVSATVAPPPVVVESAIRAPQPQQPAVPADRLSRVGVPQYFRFQLRFDSSASQLFVLFRNPFTGEIQGQVPRAAPPAPIGQQVSVGATVASQAAATQAPGAAAAARRSAGGERQAATTDSGSAGADVGRGQAIDSRV
jgi:hypothetical protein